ncbi:single-stranded DNA-binding protein [Intestinibacillus sp. Marseille-P6563]|uniref:single-stranded DNA-binding protein n=1 Tax=Intestinibacillus sp. Marseille-P6563 TaxID=2364792 RepID=UPI000F070F4E|nr:single-stranded DNA-binding protein [Intestinibacillus sp. Marseille-P6563]
MLNCIILQGRLGDTPELRHTQTGTPVATSTLAVSRNRKNPNGEYPTDWIELVFWGKTAEHASRWFNKGDMAVVRGRLESRDWEDKNGNKRRSWEVQVETIDFCGSKNENKAATRSYNVESNDFTELSESDDDVPF